jgi:hypothetical protein
MPRQSVPVDREELQAAVHGAEQANGGPFENRSRLFHAVAAGPWARDHGFAHSLICLRFNQFNLECQTPLGRLTEARKAIPGVTQETADDAEPDGSDADPIRHTVKPVEVPTASGDFFGPFTRRGVSVRTLADLMPAASKPDELNWKISDAWKEIRTNAGLVRANWDEIESRKR